MSPKLAAMHREELAKVLAFEEPTAPEPSPVAVLSLASLNRFPECGEAYRTERVLPKATMDANGNWVTEPFILTRTERGLSDRRVGDELP